MAITSTTIDIGWTPAAHPSLEVTYLVYFGDGTYIANVGTDLTYTVTGLTPNTEYSFYVRSRVEYPTVTGDELIVNSSFNAAGNWVEGPGWNISTGIDGFANNDGQVGDLVQIAVPFTPGEIYQVAFKTRNAAYSGLGLKYSLGGASFQGAASGDGVHEFEQTAGSDNNEMRLIVGSVNDFLGSVDYVSVKPFLRDNEIVYSEPTSTVTASTLP